MRLLFYLAICTSVLTACSAARILTLVAMPSRSHASLLRRLSRELATRDHNVTFVSPFPEPSTTRNLTEVGVPAVLETLQGKDFFARRRSSTLAELTFLTQLGLEVTEMFLEQEVVKALMHGPPFDLIISEAFLGEAVFSGFSVIHQAPVVVFGTCMPAFWVNYMAANPVQFSYIPDILTGYHTKMTLFERFFNAVLSIIGELNHRLYYLPRQDTLMRRYFGKHLPPVDELVRNVSLVLINHHHSLAYPRPLMANMVEVAGLHVDPPKPLPDDIKLFLDEATHGAILLSLGSNLRSENMSSSKIEVFVNALSRLDQRVLWKFEGELEKKPSNVKVAGWLPQADVLAHPNLKVFITHGGLLSIIEAVDRGVPVIGIPFFGDQPLNMKNVEHAGFGITLDFENITSDSLLDAITLVMSNSKYLVKAQERSKLLRDSPLSPLDRAVYSVEYVLRHDGAHHLKPRAQKMHWYQLYLLDTIALIAAVLLVTIFVIFFSVRKFYKFIFSNFLRAKNIKKVTVKKIN